MGVCYCAKCSKAMLESEAVLKNNLLLCPKCNEHTKDLGQEKSSVSDSKILVKYDREHFFDDHIKKYSGKVVTYESNIVDQEILECEDTLKYQPDNIEALYHLGRLYMIKGTKTTLDSAKIVFSRIIEIDDKHIESYRYLADIFMSDNDFDMALKQLEYILDMDPDNSYLLRNIGIVYMKKNEKKTAFSYFKKSYKITEDQVLKDKIRKDVSQLKLL
ncbi:MAG: hypothetical protein GY730_05290 [bacterium]|nr:hypothetical protein [bacterium]